MAGELVDQSDGAVFLKKNWSMRKLSSVVNLNILIEILANTWATGSIKGSSNNLLAFFTSPR